MKTGLGVVLTVCSFAVGLVTPFLFPTEPAVQYVYLAPGPAEPQNSANESSLSNSSGQIDLSGCSVEGSDEVPSPIEALAPTTGHEDAIEQIERVRNLLVADASLIRVVRQSKTYRRQQQLKSQVVQLGMRNAELKKQNEKLMQGTEGILNAHGDSVFPEISKALKKCKKSMELLDKSAEAAASGRVKASEKYYRAASREIARAERIVSKRATFINSGR